jgi:Universal stress protein family
VIIVLMTWKASAIDRRIAVGIDGTPLSTEAVEFAFRTAADRDQADIEQTWVSRAEVTVAETLAGWTDEYPETAAERNQRALRSNPAPIS